jgi:dimethylglycine dehydrogenase
MGLYQGMNLEILAPDEIRDKYPFIETHDLKGALYDPADGDIDPAQLTQALAKGARDLGAKILRFCPATGVSRENGEWIIRPKRATSAARSWSTPPATTPSASANGSSPSAGAPCR